MKKKICAIIAIGCAIAIISSARQSDLGLIGPLESIQRSIIALPLLFISCKIGGIIE